MKMQRAIRFCIPILIGCAFGFILLHPASMIIVDSFEKSRFSLSLLATRAIGEFFIPMGFYFAILGGAIGLVFSLHSYRINKTNSELLQIINNIEERNKIFSERIEQEYPRIKDIIKQMRPSLNKIQKLVNLLTDGNAGSVNMRQSTLLSITKGNIDNLFYVIGYMIELLEKRSGGFSDETKTGGALKERQAAGAQSETS